MYFTWQCAMRTTTSALHLPMCHAVTQPVYFNWQFAMRYHNQCISPGNVLCGTTNQCISVDIMSYGIRTTVFHLAMCDAVPQPMYFTWQCAMRYHNQCISPSNVSYATTLCAFHLTMCHTVPRPVPLTWQCVIRYHN